MGGGGKQSSTQQTSDNDIMAAEGATVVGDGGSFSVVDQSLDIGMGASYMGPGATSIDLGMGSTMLAEGATSMDGNDGVIFGDGGAYSAIDIGMGATVLAEGATSMDGNDGVIFGDGGAYSAIDIGMGATVLGDGSTNIDGNEGTIFGDGAEINSGVKLGDGSSYMIQSMDDRTADLLDNALTLMYANTENVLESSAALYGTAGSPTFLNPTPTSSGTAATSGKGMTNLTKAGLGAGALLLLAVALKGQKKQ